MNTEQLQATQEQLFVLEFLIFPRVFQPFPIKSIFMRRVFEQDYTNELCLFKSSLLLDCFLNRLSKKTENQVFVFLSYIFCYCGLYFMPVKKCSSISCIGSQKNSGGDFEFYGFTSCKLKKKIVLTPDSFVTRSYAIEQMS